MFWTFQFAVSLDPTKRLNVSVQRLAARREELRETRCGISVVGIAVVSVGVRYATGGLRGNLASRMGGFYFSGCRTHAWTNGNAFVSLPLWRNRPASKRAGSPGRLNVNATSRSYARSTANLPRLRQRDLNARGWAQIPEPPGLVLKNARR